MEDTSLDDFLDAGANSPESDDEIEPAATTFAFSPEGVICELCGDRVLERWRSEKGLVCAECKEWTATDR